MSMTMAMAMSITLVVGHNLLCKYRKNDSDTMHSTSTSAQYSIGKAGLKGTVPFQGAGRALTIAKTQSTKDKRQKQRIKNQIPWHAALLCCCVDWNNRSMVVYAQSTGLIGLIGLIGLLPCGICVE
jgi:hypothetical protein